MPKSAAAPQRDLAPAVTEFLLRHVTDAETGWSCGTFGAIAEFERSPEEPVRFETGDGIEAVTARGGIRIDPLPTLRPIAYELTSRDPAVWQHGVALCLPRGACAMARNTVVTELGPDRDALRPEDREAILFDLGLNVLQADICVRTADPETVAALRAGIGRPLLEPGNSLIGHLAARSPHRVFRCRFGRIEVYQPIPAPGGRSPDGPHTHLLPKLLAHGRTHAANLPLPEGWIPCMTMFPPNPMRDRTGRRKAFDAGQHAAFQSLWRQFGDPALVAIKAAAVEAISSGQEFSLPSERSARTVVRVALRQLHQLGHSLFAMTTLLRYPAGTLVPEPEFDELRPRRGASLRWQVGPNVH